MTKSKGIGRGRAAGSRRSRQSAAPSDRSSVGVTLSLSPSQAEQLRAMENRSGAIAAFLSENWESFVSFQAGWQSEEGSPRQ